MKTHRKNKFYFLNDDGSKKMPKNGDSYFNYEWRFKTKIPFMFNDFIEYKLINNIWVEQPK